MSELTLWQQLHSEWTSAKLALDTARTAIDIRTIEYLNGQAKPPGTKIISDFRLLLTQEKAAREEVDALITSLSIRMTEGAKVVPIRSFPQALETSP